MNLLFFEKPGCVGNRRQQALLKRQDVAFEVEDLLSVPWTATALRPFFNDGPVAEWFNLSAPKVKSGELDIEGLDEGEAIELMLREPILIRRPLLQYGSLRQSGFVPGPVLDALGVLLEPDADMQSCPMGDDQPMCHPTD